MQSMLDDDIGCDIGCGPFTSLFSRCCSCSRGYLLASVDEDDDAFDISAPNKKKDKACAYGTTESALVDNGFVRSPPVLLTCVDGPAKSWAVALASSDGALKRELTVALNLQAVVATHLCGSNVRMLARFRWLLCMTMCGSA